MESGWIIGSCVLAVIALVVAVTIRTGWMQSGTMRKCVVLAGVLHLTLAIVAAMVGGLTPASWGQADTGRMTMAVVLEESLQEDVVASDSSPSVDAAGVADAVFDTSEPAGSQEDGASESSSPSPANPADADTAAESIAAIDESDIVPLLDGASEPSTAKGHALQETLSRVLDSASPRSVPSAYADRTAGRRAAAAAARGGSEETERAVGAGLEWLRRSQSADGRWSAARHGATVERSSDGVDRHGSGVRCDNGVTALALLAFLGAGSTHVDGPYAAEVARGVDFLVAGQTTDGSLAGDAEFFTALYCHGMGTIALAEAASMSGDRRLLQSLGRAVGYTVRTQHPSTGGWRYAAGDRGDTSQLGWQVMALSSAGLAGVSGLETPLRRAASFLPSVSSGASGGLACYRPGERSNPTMTAEALLCRLLLGVHPSDPAVAEAVRTVATSPPESGSVNVYRWYYSTLALYHVGGPDWDRWNSRMQRVLVDLQRRSGSLDGSWDPDAVWGGHGGRVYSTALSVMTLEVYYRYQPLYASGAQRL